MYVCLSIPLMDADEKAMSTVQTEGLLGISLRK